MELARAPHGMNAAEKPSHPFPLVGGTEFGPTSAASRKDGIAKPAMQVQRLAAGGQGRYHGNFLRGQLCRESMLLADGRIAPATRPVELGDHRLAVFDADLVDPILVAVEREDPAIAAKSPRLERIEHGFGG